MIALDNLDRSIIKLLVSNKNFTPSDISRHLEISQSKIWRRVKNLTEHGVLTGKKVIVDRKMLGFGVTVFLGVKLATKRSVSLADFERAACSIPEVQLVQHVLGLYDYRLRVVAKDISDFERVLRRRIMTLPGVGDVEANVLLSEEYRSGPLG